MPLAQHLVVKLQRPLEQRPRRLEVPLLMDQERQVVEPLDGVGVPLALDRAVKLQGALEQRPRRLEVPLPNGF